MSNPKAALSVSRLAQELKAEILGLDAQTQFSAVSCSSNNLSSNALFVALRGSSRDGHDFIPQALANGAAAVVADNRQALHGAPALLVQDSRLALSRLAYLFSGCATDSLINIGLTGTNGKTTTTWLIYELLEALGHSAVRIGTLGVYARGFLDSPGELTTPDAVELHSIFEKAAQNKREYCVMEVSSHALAQGRVQDVRFDLAVFSNLTRDHLDFHLSMERYYAAKKHLFELTARAKDGKRVALINTDCEYGAKLHEELRGLNLDLSSFGFNSKADFCIVDFYQDLEGSRFKINFMGESVLLQSKLIGQHNAYNLSAAFASALKLGFDKQRISDVLGNIAYVPGRLEAVGRAGLGVFVDYSHTPDALQNALKSLRPLTKKKLWAVFGCGGDRDKGKRPQMARIARTYADCITVTSDNPRTEDPQAIIRDILAEGVEAELVESDRRQAIYKTLAAASPGDIVLIAGKGHEDYQVIGTTKVHLSDVEEARKALDAIGLK